MTSLANAISRHLQNGSRNMFWIYSNSKEGILRRPAANWGDCWTMDFNLLLQLPAALRLLISGKAKACKTRLISGIMGHDKNSP
ncbi:MAG: hypothetical protein KGQ46_15205 [Hyphomicrobiales bacterium]|nr:hypothetical protein [Hyphomicrobiales bacterium]MDE2115793.1 hypothetical protein [Hyphomicrobiales bacterium]